MVVLSRSCSGVQLKLVNVTAMIRHWTISTTITGCGAPLATTCGLEVTTLRRPDAGRANRHHLGQMLLHPPGLMKTVTMTGSLDRQWLHL